MTDIATLKDEQGFAVKKGLISKNINKIKITLNLLDSLYFIKIIANKAKNIPTRK